jgi:hypothetical protein
VLYVLAESTARAAAEQARETERLDGDRYVVGVSLASEDWRAKLLLRPVLLRARLELFACQIGIGWGVALLDLRFSGYEGSLAGARAPMTFLSS